jgi:hypothetical protein
MKKIAFLSSVVWLLFLSTTAKSLPLTLDADGDIQIIQPEKATKMSNLYKVSREVFNWYNCKISLVHATGPILDTAIAHYGNLTAFSSCGFREPCGGWRVGMERLNSE